MCRLDSCPAGPRWVSGNLSVKGPSVSSGTKEGRRPSVGPVASEDDGHGLRRHSRSPRPRGAPRRAGPGVPGQSHESGHPRAESEAAGSGQSGRAALARARPSSLDADEGDCQREGDPGWLHRRAAVRLSIAGGVALAPARLPFGTGREGDGPVGPGDRVAPPRAADHAPLVCRGSRSRAGAPGAGPWWSPARVAPRARDA